MVPNKQILFQDIHGRILADGCQMYPEQYQNYDFHKESRFIYVLPHYPPLPILFFTPRFFIYQGFL